MSARLKILQGKNTGTCYVLGSVTLIGRDEDNQLQLLDETCSRHHAKIERLQDGCHLSNLGSNNGTFLNGERIEKAKLEPGDRILIGNTLLVFEVEAATSPGAPPTVIVSEQEEGLRIKSTLAEKEAAFPAEPATQDASRFYGRLHKLYELSNTLVSILDAEELFRRLLGIVLESLPAQRAFVLLRDRQTGDLKLACGRSRKEGTLSDVAISRSIANSVLEKRQGLLVEDARAEKAWATKESLLRERIRSVLAVPLVHRGECFGLLYADSPATDELPAFGRDDLEFLTGAAQQAALALQNAERYSASQSEIRELRRATLGSVDIVGQSPKFLEALSVARKAARSPSTVLLTGESGTGKELVARLIHHESDRASGPFVALNCAALPESLLESELFGHEKGAFTGATERRKGKFELAHDGTIFLDEIAEMPVGLQSKLLRVLQERQFYTVGGTKPVTVNVRILAATNRPPEQSIAEGRLREDLYYRLGVITIELPPLRERVEDIPLLADYFLRQAGRETKRPGRSIAPKALDALRRYRWPGNVRELGNLIERAVVLSDGPVLGVEAFPPEARREAAGAAPNAQGAPPLDPLSLQEAERQCILRAMEATGWKKGEAARLLGISWPTLNKKLSEYGLTKPPEK